MELPEFDWKTHPQEPDYPCREHITINMQGKNAMWTIKSSKGHYMPLPASCHITPCETVLVNTH